MREPHSPPQGSHFVLRASWSTTTPKSHIAVEVCLSCSLIFLKKIMTKLIILVALVLLVGATLDDQEFLKKYQVNITNRGTFAEYPHKGDTVNVHYTGRLLDGTKFDSSKDRNQPFSFKVGTGQVIKCWDEVILQLTLGDVVTVTCPSDTAYGSRGAGGKIPPNADIQFDIEMLGFREHKLEDL